MSPIVLRIAEFRESKEWTQGQLAREAGVPQPTISRLESTTKPPRSVDFAILERLAKALGKHPGELIGLERGKPTPRRQRRK